MKKTMKNVLLLMCALSAHASAQQVDTTSPYVWREEEVVDTLKAVQTMAARRDTLTRQIELLTTLRQTKKKKVATDDEKALLQNLVRRCFHENVEVQTQHGGRYYVRHPYFLQGGHLAIITHTRVGSYGPKTESNFVELLQQGTLHPSLLAAFDSIVPALTDEAARMDASTDADFARFVYPLPTKMAPVRHDNPYYADPAFHWLDSLKQNNTLLNRQNKMTAKTVSYPVKDEYYTSNIFTQFKFRTSSSQPDIRWNTAAWRVYDATDRLVAVSASGDIDSLRLACFRYDFEHNAYGIDGEPAAVRSYVKHYLSTGKTPQAEITYLELEPLRQAQAMRVAMQLSMAMMNTSELNEMKRQSDALVAESKRKADALRSRYPKDVMERGEAYIDQLKADNAYDSDRLQTTRLDGLSFMVTPRDGGRLKARLTFGFDAKEGKLVPHYTILEK